MDEIRIFECVEGTGDGISCFLKGKHYALTKENGNCAYMEDSGGYRWRKGLRFDMTLDELNNHFGCREIAKFKEIALDKDLIGKKVRIVKKTGYDDNFTFDQLLSFEISEALEQERNGYVIIEDIGYNHTMKKYYYAIGENYYNREDFVLCDYEKVYGRLVVELRPGDRKYSIVDTLMRLAIIDNQTKISNALRDLFGSDNLIFAIKTDLDNYKIFAFDIKADGNEYKVYREDKRYFILRLQDTWSKWSKAVIDGESILYRTKGKITQVKTHDGYSGQTKCIGNDEYDEEIGIRIAMTNAMIKRYEKLCQKQLDIKRRLII